MYLSRALELVAAHFPELREKVLPCGGRVFYEPAGDKRDVHILFSPLSVAGQRSLVDDVSEVHLGLGRIAEVAYAPMLSQFNGASFLSSRIELYGHQAPHSVNQADRGYYPARLATPNHYERPRGIPITELMIGVLYEPNRIVTLDESGVVRLRDHSDGSMRLELDGIQSFLERVCDATNASG